jgi:hypothetical protein
VPSCSTEPVLPASASSVIVIVDHFPRLIPIQDELVPHQDG